MKGSVLIVNGPFRGLRGDILIEQKVEYPPSESVTFAYQLRLPSGWILNIPADCVAETTL